MKKENSETVTIAVLVKILESLVKFFNVGKSMTDFQIIETCKLVLHEYYFLKLEDLKLCFDGMKTGKYLPGGKLFDRLDGNIILTALNTYTEERIVQAELISNEKHKAMQDEYDAETYLVKINGNYVMGSVEDGEEVELKDLASKYSFREAIRIKDHLTKNYPEDTISIVYSNKSEIGLIDYLTENLPDMVMPDEKYKRKTVDYFIEKKKIEDSDLTPQEKEEAKKKLVNSTLI